jgi:drug/metabolite transporter superfamily protein YnfA
MIASHFGVASLADAAAEPSFAQWLLMSAGSHAPVIFFYCTGVGYGMKAPGRLSPRKLGDLAYKAMLLVVADQFLRSTQPSVWGLDFLAFIGITTFISGLLAASKNGSAYAAAGILVVMALRFGSKVFGVPESITGHGAQAWLFGISGIAGVSYPMSPWLCYPLIGFLVGRFSQLPTELTRAARAGWGWAAVAVGLALACGLVLQKGLVIFRWGTVSIGFFVFSLAALLMSNAWGRWMSRTKTEPPRPLSAAFAVNGMASLAVVPLHYVIITTLEKQGLILTHGLWTLAAEYVAVTLLTLWLARACAFRLAHLTQSHPAHATAGLVTVAAVLLLASVLGAFESAGTATRLCTLLLGQLAVCGLLSRRTRTTS